MSFIGKEGLAAPRLKDAELNEEMLRKVYVDILIYMWKLYHECRLIHADLSEYNIL
jgi:RIO kinase 1